MMVQNQYIIQQYTFDIGFYDQSKVHALQNMFSKLFYDQAMPVMEAVFQTMIPPGQLVKSDRLEIDIGPIPYERVNYVFAERFKEALEKELTLLLAERQVAGSDQLAVVDVVSGSLASLLEYFLMTGSLPWWASQQTTAGPLQAMEQLMQNMPAQLIQLLLRAGKHDYVRRRLVYQFPEPLLHRIISLLKPEQASFIFSYHKGISYVQQREKIIHREIREVEKAIWIFILDYLLTEHGNYFNRKTFVRHTLQRMARHFNLAYQHLLGLLAAAVQKNELPLQPVDALPVIVYELAHEQDQEMMHDPLQPLTGDAITETTTPAVVQQHLDLVRYYFLFGSLPARAASVDRKRLLQLLAQAIDQVPESVKRMISVLAVRQQVQERMAAVLDDVTMHKVIRMEEPAEADFIFRYVDTLQVQQHKRSLVKAEGNEFRQSVWQFILAFLYTEKGSVFNSRMFLKSHIHRMARHYRLTYGQMLVFLVQGMGEEMQATDDSSLFHLLADLLQEFRQQQNEPATLNEMVEVMQAPDDSTDTYRATIIRDVLAHWLVHDQYPWWNTSYKHRSPASLWKELLRLSPVEAQWLVQLAMEQEPAFYRLLNTATVEELLPGIDILISEGFFVQSEKAGQGISRRALDAALQQIHKEPVKQWLRASLQSPVVARFMAQSYPAEKTIFFIEQLFTAQAAETVVLLRTIEKWLAVQVTDTLERDRFQVLLWEFALFFLATGRPVSEPAAFFAGWIRLVAARRGGMIHLLHTSLTGPGIDFPYAGLLRQQVLEVMAVQKGQPLQPPVQEAYWQQLVQQTGRDIQQQWQEDLEQIARELAVKKQQAAEEQRKEIKKRLQAENATLYVSNAGLVLLHPFLNTLFSRLQWIEKGHFVSEEAQQRAVHLLQFLVSGDEQHPEHLLMLNKLLCGFPLEEPVTADIVLTQTEKNTAEELLQVMLQRWEKLKNTSVEGLRVSFLQRTGALIASPDHWTLRVEQRGIDVLLSFLPWGFSVIKSSWMKKTLFVEWT